AEPLRILTLIPRRTDQLRRRNRHLDGRSHGHHRLHRAGRHRTAPQGSPVMLTTINEPTETNRVPRASQTLRNGRTRGGTMRPRKSIVLTVIYWTLLAYFLLPLIWLLISSTKSNGDLFTTFGLAFPSELHF